ncbi:MAG: putative enzyme of poly-gamma-glutamate biosynthesis [Geobacteraceae bacterium]|nr:MAG: putative enzyme of poly-gamma-glutamate biosynthesis [Geobacteraceae bacterium]
MLSHFIITIFMCGDVMTGRGIDQILPHPSVPHIYEPFVRDARVYVDLAEDAHGPIRKPADFSYIWGDALATLDREAPDARIINLETSVTRSEDYWRGKGINYRMHPENIPAITKAKIDVCALANNHVLDWGYAGLAETLQTLHNAGLKGAGAGRDIREAEAPALLEVKGKGRVLVFSFGAESSGIPESWAAAEKRPGVNLLHDLSEMTVHTIKAKIRKVKRQGDIVIASVHWGGNWGFDIPREQTEFARKLIDEAGIDVIHGHSSHHVKGIEVYRDKPIIYGCGDFINDYEGISGYEWYRGDLGLMYFVRMDPTIGKLAGLRMIPTQVKRFRVTRAAKTDAIWLRDTLNREGKQFGTRVELDEDNVLTLHWK